MNLFIQGEHSGRYSNYLKSTCTKIWDELLNLNSEDSRMECSNSHVNESIAHEYEGVNVTVSQALRKYPAKRMRAESKDLGIDTEISISQTINSFYRAPLKLINKNIQREEPKGKQFDDFVELHIADYIPCMLIPPEISSSKLIIYFHANAEDIGQSNALASEIGEYLSCYMLLAEYIGYSIYPGDSNEERILSDTLHVWNYATKVLGFQTSDIVIMGRSIGTGPSLHLSTEITPAALCLISPFTSIKDATKYNYGGIASSVLKERFNNKEKIEKVNCPVLFIHGKEDSLIPFDDSRKLYSNQTC